MTLPVKTVADWQNAGRSVRVVLQRTQYDDCYKYTVLRYFEGELAQRTGHLTKNDAVKDWSETVGWQTYKDIKRC